MRVNFGHMQVFLAYERQISELFFEFEAFRSKLFMCISQVGNSRSRYLAIAIKIPIQSYQIVRTYDFIYWKLSGGIFNLGI